MTKLTQTAKTYGPLPGLVDALSAKFDDAEWAARLKFRALWWRPSLLPARHIVFATKPIFLRAFANRDPRAREVAFMCKSTLPRVAEVRWLLTEAKDRSIRFVGDLDPKDLTIYLCLQHAASIYGGTVTYVGAGARWLERVEANLLVPVSHALIAMTKFEKAHWALLREQTEMDNVVDRGMALLNSGFKLELEGTLAQSIFRPEHRAELSSLVLHT